MVVTTGGAAWIGLVSLTLLCATSQPLSTVRMLIRKRAYLTLLMLVAAWLSFLLIANWSLVVMIDTIDVP